MKDSGIEWIGEIPEDWEVVKLKYVSKIQTGNTPSTSKEEYYTKNSNGIPWIKPDNLLGFLGVSDSKEKLTNEGVKYGRIVPRDTLLICSIGSIGKFGYARSTCAYNQQINSILFDEKVFSRYGMYYMSVQDKQQEMLSNGNVVKILNTNNQKNIKITLPPKDQQEKIANFLDQKVGEIDRVIEKTKEVIEDYKSYKQSLITETVTKGLRKDVALKDSGIEWIGEIPEHWEVVKGKYILTLLNRKVLSSDNIVTCFRDGEVTLRSNRRIDGFTIATKEIGYQGVEKGDMVVHGMDGFAGAIGISDSRGKASPVLNIMDTKESKKYLVYYLRSLAYKDVFLALSTGIRERSTDLRWNKISQLGFALPPLDEQKEIAGYLDEKCGHIDRIIETKEGLIKELEAYKKSLIYETVTGKREVD